MPTRINAINTSQTTLKYNIQSTTLQSPARIALFDTHVHESVVGLRHPLQSNPFHRSRVASMTGAAATRSLRGSIWEECTEIRLGRRAPNVGPGILHDRRIGHDRTTLNAHAGRDSPPFEQVGIEVVLTLPFPLEFSDGARMREERC